MVWQNAFQVAFFFWSWVRSWISIFPFFLLEWNLNILSWIFFFPSNFQWKFGFPSCFHKNAADLAIRLTMGWVSLATKKHRHITLLNSHLFQIKNFKSLSLFLKVYVKSKHYGSWCIYIFRVIIQVHCSYVTLPLYALVTQVGTLIYIMKMLYIYIYIYKII